MKVTLIANTELAMKPGDSTYSVEDMLPFSWENKDNETQYTDGTNASDYIAEFAGRLCYRAFHRPNEGTAQNSNYIANIIKQMHFSVLEHASATFLIENVSRSLTHELIRHRHFSYSQVSQRYVPHDETAFVVPPIIAEMNLDAELADSIADMYIDSRLTYSAVFQALRDQGFGVKAARGAARAFLLESTSTDIVVTGNHRAWREFLVKRNSPHADQEIHDLAALLLSELKKIAPNTYQDMS